MFRLFGWLFGFGIFCALGVAAVAVVYVADLSNKLPDYTVLKDYQPPVTTRVHAADGTLLAEGRIRIGCVDAASLRPRRMPPALLCRVRSLLTNRVDTDRLGTVFATRLSGFQLLL